MAQSQKHVFWQKHLRAWQASDLSQAAYCQAHALSLASFGYWRKRVTIAAGVAPKIIPVVREAPSAGVQLRSPGGWLVALPASLSVESLRALVAALP